MGSYAATRFDILYSFYVFYFTSKHFYAATLLYTYVLVCVRTIKKKNFVVYVKKVSMKCMHVCTVMACAMRVVTRRACDSLCQGHLTNLACKVIESWS